MSEHSTRGRVIVEIGAEVAGDAPAFGSLDHEEMQVEDGSGRTRGNRDQLHATERAGLRERALMGEIDLEERIAARVAVRLQGADQALEGQILILDGG